MDASWLSSKVKSLFQSVTPGGAKTAGQQSPVPPEMGTALTPTVFAELKPMQELPPERKEVPHVDEAKAPTKSLPQQKGNALRPTPVAMLVPAGYKPGPKQQHLLEAMVAQINELQDFLGVQIKVGCGLRTYEDIARLIAQKYNPSRTSDHFYGIPILQKDGSYYVDSVGAVDLYIWDLPKLFQKIVAFYASEPDATKRPHQIIYETGKVSDWLHIASRVSACYAPALAPKMISKRPLLYSFDCGKSYQVFDPKAPPAKLA